MRAALLPLLLLAVAAPAQADSPLPDEELAYTQLPDPAQEHAAKELMANVRCIVCQGQSVADSDAQLAGTMRAVIRRKIAEGETPDQVKAWLVERYGNYVTYDPPLSVGTFLLWSAPLLFLGLGFALARGRFRRRA